MKNTNFTLLKRGGAFMDTLLKGIPIKLNSFGLLPILLLFCCFFMGTNTLSAQSISVTKTNPGGSADNSGTNIFDAPGAPGCFSVVLDNSDFPSGNYIVTDVSVRVVFTKEPGSTCGDGGDSSGSPFLNEMGLGFQKDGQQIALIDINSYPTGGPGVQTGDYIFSASSTAGCPINMPPVLPTGTSTLPAAGTYSPTNGTGNATFLDLRGSDACGEYSFCFKDATSADPLCVSLVEVTVTAEPLAIDCFGFVGPFCESDITASGKVELNDFLTPAQMMATGPDTDCDGVVETVDLMWEWFIDDVSLGAIGTDPVDDWTPTCGIYELRRDVDIAGSDATCLTDGGMFCTRTVTVYPDPDPSWTPPAAVCAGTMVPLTPDNTTNIGTPTGDTDADVCIIDEDTQATWSGGPAGALTNGADETATFNTTGLPAGIYDITYSVGKGECPEIETHSITVMNANANWNGTGLCTSGEVIDLDDLLETTATAGGVWSDGGNGSGVTAGGSLDPSGLTAGFYPIVYTVTVAGCDNVTHEDVISILECAPNPGCEAEAGSLSITAGAEICPGEGSFSIMVQGENILYPDGVTNPDPPFNSSDGDPTNGIYFLDFYAGVGPVPSNPYLTGAFGDINFQVLATEPGIGGNPQLDFSYNDVTNIWSDASGNIYPQNTLICVVGSVWSEIQVVENDTDPGQPNTGPIAGCGDATDYVCFTLISEVAYDGAETYACSADAGGNIIFISDDQVLDMTLGTITDGSGTYTVCGGSGVYSDVSGTALVFDGSVSIASSDVINVHANQPWNLSICDENGCELEIAGLYSFPEGEIDVAGFACTTGNVMPIFYGAEDGNNLNATNFPNLTTVSLTEFGSATGALTDNGDGTASWDPAISGEGDFEILLEIVDGTTGCARSTFEEIRVETCSPACSSVILDLSLQQDDVCDGSTIDLSIPITPDMVALVEAAVSTGADVNGEIDTPAEETALLALFEFGVNADANDFADSPYTSLGTHITSLGTGLATFGFPENPSVFINGTFTHSGPDNCTPENYIVYAFLNAAQAATLGVEPSCQPWVAEAITVWPDPANTTITATTVDCVTTFTSSCPNMIVSPSSFVATEGDAAANVNVTVSIPGNECAADVKSTPVPACELPCQAEAGSLAISAGEVICPEEGNFVITFQGDITYPIGLDGDATTGFYFLDFYTVTTPPTPPNPYASGVFGDIFQVPAATPGTGGAPQFEFSFDAASSQWMDAFGNIFPSDVQICVTGSVWDEGASFDNTDPGQPNSGPVAGCGDATDYVCFTLTSPISAFTDPGTYTCSGTNVNGNDEFVALAFAGDFLGGGTPALDGSDYTICGGSGIYSDTNTGNTFDFEPGFQATFGANEQPEDNTAGGLFVISNQPWSMTICDNNGCSFTIEGVYNMVEPELFATSFACNTQEDPIILWGDPGFNFITGNSNFEGVLNLYDPFTFAPLESIEVGSGDVGALGVLTDLGLDAIPGVIEDLTLATINPTNAWDNIIDAGFSTTGQLAIDLVITDAATGCVRIATHIINIEECAPECAAFPFDVAVPENEVCSGQTMDVQIPLTSAAFNILDVDASGTLEPAELALVQLGVLNFGGTIPSGIFDDFNPYELESFGAIETSPADFTFTNASIGVNDFSITSSGFSVDFCGGEDYMIFAYFASTAFEANGGPIPDDCQPWAAETVTVYPDPNDLIIVSVPDNTNNCDISFQVQDANGTVCTDYQVGIVDASSGSTDIIAWNSIAADAGFTALDLFVIAPNGVSNAVNGQCFDQTATPFIVPNPIDAIPGDYTYSCGNFLGIPNGFNNSDEMVLLQVNQFLGGGSPFDFANDADPSEYLICGGTGVYGSIFGFISTDANGNPLPLDFATGFQYSFDNASGLIGSTDVNANVSDAFGNLVDLFVLSNQPWSLTICDANGCELTLEGGYNFPTPEIYMSSAACITEDVLDIVVDPNSNYTLGDPFFSQFIDLFNPNLTLGASLVYTVDGTLPFGVSTALDGDGTAGSATAFITTNTAADFATFTPFTGTLDVQAIMAAAAAAGDPLPGTIGVDFAIEDSATGCSRTVTQFINLQSCNISYEILAPCACNDDASVNGDDGTFTETVAITAPGGAALGANQIWTVQANTGATGIAVGDALTFNALTGHYELTFDHVDAQGYFVTVEGPAAAGTAGNITQQIANVCFYPDPQIAGFGPLCVTEPMVPLNGIPANGVTGTGVFSGTGVVGTNFDPAVAGVGTHNITYTFTDDAAGNGTHNPGCAQAVSIDVVVYGDEVVFQNCPSDIVIAADSDECSAKVNWDIPTATNTCDGTVLATVADAGNIYAPGDIIPVGGPYTIGYSAADGNGGTTTCSFTIMVMDTQDPQFDADIVMPGDITVECDAVPEAFVLTNDDVNDNCTASADLILTYAEVRTDGNCANNFTLTRTWTITDAAGNVTTHIQTITVQDTTNPIALCQDATVTLDEFGMGSIVIADIDNGSSDNCTADANLAFGLSQSNFDCNDVDPDGIEITLTVTDECANEDTCTATVTVEEGDVPCTPTYDVNGSDPCVCMNNATTLDNGQFAEFIQFEAVAGDVVTVTSVTGLFLETSPAPPAAPIALPVGTPLLNGTVDGVDNDGDGAIDEADENTYYTLSAIHIDGQGYEIQVTGGNFGLSDVLSNTCFYPTPEFVDLPSEFCLGTIFEIVVEDAFDAVADAITITVDGNPVAGNIFDASTLGLGTHVIEATFDAGAAGQFTLENGLPIGTITTLADAQADPGCQFTISETVEVVETPSQLVCNDLVNISLAADDCLNDITPDMVLEGGYACFDDYNVVLNYPFGTNVYDPANQIDGSHVGSTMVYTLVHPISGNVCWGEVLVEDKAAPVLECAEDITITCAMDIDDLTQTGAPTSFDCSNFSVDYSDVTILDNGACGDVDGILLIVERTFIAIDEYNNVSECTQTITVERSITSVTIPGDIAWSCEQYAANSNITDASALLFNYAGLPTHTDFDVADASALTGNNMSNTGSGYPNIAGVGVNNGSCMLSVSYEDDHYDVCGDGASFEILRTWKVRDMCAPLVPGVNPSEDIQIIKVSDENGPEISLPAEITVSANVTGIHPVPCTADFTLPTATITDACSSVTSIETIHPFGTNDTNGGPLSDLSIGDYNVTYVATDACGNVSTRDLLIHVVDDITPTPVCDELTQVALDGSGNATVYAETFDDGSYDNCGLERLEVRRMADNCGRTGNTTFNNDGHPNDANNDTDNGEFVTFCCEDINFDIDGNPVPVMVVLRVFDYEGLYNECMVEVLVEDKIAPVVTCDMTIPAITCTTYFDNYQATLDILAEDAANDNIHPDALNAIFDEALVTAPTVTDNCGYTTDLSWDYDVDNCGNGTITRTWSNIEDNSGNSWNGTCVQTIEVNHENSWSITFPEDKDWECDEDSEDLGEPDVFEDNCELIAISMEDQLFNIVPDACYKIFRTYTAINWCVYNGNESSAVNVGAPAGTNDDSNIATRRYADGGDGIVVYRQVIKVQDFEAPVITLGDDVDGCITGPTSSGEVCKKDVVVNPVSVTDCDNNGSDIVITYTLYTIADVELNSTETTSATDVGRTYSDLDLGDYKVIITAMDNCGNQSSVEYLFSVTDCKAPTPYCVGSLVVELMPIDTDGDGVSDAGMVELWSTDFNAGSFDNCTDSIGLKYTMTHGIENFAESTANWEFDCGSLTEGNDLDIYLFVEDEAENVDYCLTTLVLESVDNVCPEDDTEEPDELNVAGALATENDAPVAGVTVELNNGSASTSNAEGEYSLNATTGADVTVTPMYDVYDNSVTTYDLVIIRQHILTTSLLNSPYKVIAADVNNSGAVTGADIIAAKKVILGIETTYPNNNAWTFVDANYTFASDWNLATDGYPAVTSINNIAQDEIADFVAVRIGDVNGTYGFADDADERNSFNINANDAKLVAGQEYTVEFTASDYAALGYQFTLNFTNLEVVSIDGNTEDFGIFANAITTSYNGEKEGDKLFAVTFKATTNVTVSEVLDITSNITKAEAYNANGVAMPVVLEFNNSDSDFALYQNSPNPFAGRTVVGFSLPTASAATLTITDISGKVLSVIKGEYTTGYNEVSISNLDATGVLYYQLDTPTNSAVRKMVVID